MGVPNGGIVNSNGRVCLNEVKDAKGNYKKGIYKHSWITGIVLSLFGSAFYDKDGGFLDKKSTIRYLKDNSAAFGGLSTRINALTDSASKGSVKDLFKDAKQTAANAPKPEAKPKPKAKLKEELKPKLSVEVQTFKPISKSTKLEFKPGVSTNIESVEVEFNDNTFNKENFEKYLFEKNPERQNRALLEATVMQGKTPKKISYHLVKSGDMIEKLWTKPIVSQDITMTLQKDFFKYNEEGHCYVDFAHATSFGGGYRTNGSVQEERMFFGFTSLAFLGFMTNGGVHPCIDNDGKHKRLPPNTKPQPFIIEGICADFDLSKVPYGREKLKALSDEAIKAGVQSRDNFPPVDILGLAAIDWSKISEKRYTEEHLKYLFGAALLGFMGVKESAKKRGMERAVVHTAPWGCGVFQNSYHMMTAIQYLAAKMAGVDLVMHDVRDKPPFDKDNISSITEFVDEIVKPGTATLEDLFNELISMQEEDEVGPLWCPQVPPKK